MGGALSVRPGIVAGMKRMDHMLEISQQSLTVRVQSGMRLRPLGEQLAAHGLMLGHDPWSISVATVGGAIGTHGLGYLGGRYGSIGAQVLGLEVVLVLVQDRFWGNVVSCVACDRPQYLSGS